jgi:hypothetical protein
MAFQSLIANLQQLKPLVMRNKTTNAVIIALCFSLFCISAYSQDCPKRTGTIKDNTGSPIPGVTVTVKGTHNSTVATADGSFSINVCPGDILTFDVIGLTSTSLAVQNGATDSNAGGLQIHLSGQDSGFSPYSYWSGAKLSYNVNSKATGADKFVGGASFLINSVQLKSPNVKMDVVGNIGNFSSSDSDDENGKKITKIAQSESGLSMGLAFTRPINWGVNSEYSVRPYFITGHKLNSFAATKKDSSGNAKTDTGTVALNQWHNTLGVEFEGFKWS